SERRRGPLADLDAARESPCLESKRTRAVFPRRDRPPVGGVDRCQREHAGSGRATAAARQSVLPWIHVARVEHSWLRRLAGRAAIPDDQGERQAVRFAVVDDGGAQLATDALMAYCRGLEAGVALVDLADFYNWFGGTGRDE